MNTYFINYHTKCIETDLLEILGRLQEISSQTTFSLSERRAMRAAGVRRWGFINLVSNTANEQSEFSPTFFDAEVLKRLIEQLIPFTY